MGSNTEDIKSRLDITDFIRQYVRLEKSGINFRGLCPFHKEKTPSFFISPARQIWRCFGCGVGGDIFSFVQQIEGLDFPEALRMLAERAGVQLTHYDAAQQNTRARFLEACEAACQFFQAQLASGDGQRVSAYLRQRGVSDESTKEFRLGYSPQDSLALGKFLRLRGFSEKDIITAGLAFSSDRTGELHDRFHGRIMFPIANLHGQVIAFGGRIQEEEKKRMEAKGEHAAKYINSPQTPLYDKSSVLYGLDKAKLAIRQKDACILVEGYTDVILAHQAGWKNVVASSGTALTERQLELIQRYSNTLLSCFDMDAAGDIATKRGIDIAQTKGFNIKVISFGGGKDPADIIREDIPSWEKAVESAQGIIEFYFASALARHDAAKPEHKVSIGRMILPMIARIANRIEQSHWVSRLADVLRVAEGDVWIELQKTSTSLRKNDSARQDAPILLAKTNEDAHQQIKERLLVLLLKHPNLQEQFRSDEIISPIFSQSDSRLENSQLDNMLAIIVRSVQPLGEEQVSVAYSKEEADAINHLFFRDEVLRGEEEHFEEEFFALLREWQKRVVHQQLADIHGEMRMREQEGGDENNISVRAQELIERLAKLS